MVTPSDAYGLHVQLKLFPSVQVIYDINEIETVRYKLKTALSWKCETIEVIEKVQPAFTLHIL